MSSTVIRIDDDVYRLILAEKHRLEAERGRVVTFSDALREWLKARAPR